MKSRTSYFSKGIFMSDTKRFSWIFAAYMVALIFTMPISLLIKVDKFYRNMPAGTIYFENNQILRLFRFESADKLLIFTVPVVTAIFLFRYMQSKDSADMFHSLPISRIAIFNSKLAVGTLFLTVPLLITGAICILIRQTVGLWDFYTINSVLNWMNISILMNMVIFTSSVFFGMITGSSVAQGAFTYIFLFFPVGIIGLLIYNLRIFVHGFAADYYFTNKIANLSPLTRIGELSSNSFNMSVGEIAAYVALCALFSFAALTLYKARNIESYSKIVAFKPLEPVLKYGVAFCTTLLGGLYFSEVSSGLGWSIFGYAAGGAIGYAVSVMTIKKSFYVFSISNFRGIVGYAAFMLLMAGAIRFDVLGFESKLPDPSKVERVYFAGSIYAYNSDYEHTRPDMHLYSERLNIENIVDLHTRISKDKSTSNHFGENTRRSQSMYFIYELDNGSKMARQYDIPSEKEVYKACLKPIYESLEHKNMNYDVLALDPGIVEKIVMSPSVSDFKELSILSKEEISQFIALAKEDIIDASYEEILLDMGSTSHVEIIVKNRNKDKEKYLNYGFTFKKGYDNVENWLSEKGYLKDAVLNADDVKKIVVEERTDSNSYSIKEYTYAAEDSKSVKRLDITDKDKIANCLETYKNRIESDSRYIVGIYTKNGQKEYVSFDNGNIPEFVDSYFN